MMFADLIKSEGGCIAVHEAGHALVALALGASGATIVPGGEEQPDETRYQGWPRPDCTPIRDVLTVIMAGEAAERLAGVHPLSARSHATGDYWQAVLLLAREPLEDLQDPLEDQDLKAAISRARSRARRLLLRRYGDLLHTAEAALECGSVSVQPGRQVLN